MELFGLIIPVFIVLAILIRVLAGSFDGNRVEQYIRSMGGTLLDKSWDPFGPGWFGEKESRIYQIVYRDRAGYVHRAHVKTSALSGVYLTNDHIIEHPQPLPAPQQQQLPHPPPRTSLSAARPPELPDGYAGSIEAEKQQLRQRLAELEKLAPSDPQRRA